MENPKRSDQAQQMIEYIVHEVIRRPGIQITEDTPLVSSGLIDSLALVNILLKLEDISQMRIPAGILSMALFGLWHAARLTFVVWGIYHGLLLAAHRLGQQLKTRVPFNWPAYVGRALAWFGTFALVSLGWIFFRANSLEQALAMLRSVLSPGHYQYVVLPADFYVLTTVVIIGYFVYHALGILLTPWRALDKEELQPG